MRLDVCLKNSANFQMGGLEYQGFVYGGTDLHFFSLLVNSLNDLLIAKFQRFITILCRPKVLSTVGATKSILVLSVVVVEFPLT